MKFKTIICFVLISVLIASYPLAVRAIGPRESSISSHGTFVSNDGNNEIVRINAGDLTTIARGVDEVDAQLDNMDTNLTLIESTLTGDNTATEADVLQGKTFSSEGGGRTYGSNAK